MELLTAAQWDLIKTTEQNGADTVCKKQIDWYRVKNPITPFMETPERYTYDKLTLLGLINYNYMRSWPITESTESGEYDKQSVQILFNKVILKAQGFLDINNIPQYDPALDRLIIDHYLYKPSGDTWVAQIEETDGYWAMIAKRDQITKVTPIAGGYWIAAQNGGPIVTGQGEKIAYQ